MIKSKCKILNISVINLLSSTAEYISLIILALYLNENISIVKTSIIIGVTQMIATFMSSLSSPLEKKLGMSKSLCISSILSGISYIGYYITNDFIGYLFFAILLGFANVLWKPLIKSLFSSCSTELTQADNVHRVRYITICLASILGSLLSLFISNHYTRATCLLVSGIIYIVIGIYLSVRFSSIFKNHFTKEIKIKKHFCLKEFFIKDIYLIIYILMGTLVYFVFVQFENIYSLFLLSYPSPDKIFAILLTINSVCGLLFQLLLIAKTKNLAATKSIQIGIAFFQVAFMIFGISFMQLTPNPLWLLIMAVVIYSVGEVLTIPALDIIIDNIAPNDKKSLYFGIAEIRNIGFALGPVFAGYLLELKGASFASFVSVFILLLVSIPLFIIRKLKK